MANQEVASFYATLSAESGDFDRAMKSAKGSLSGLESSAGGLGSMLKTGLTVAFTASAAAVGGLAAGIGVAINAAMGFEQQAANISAVFGDMAPPIEEVKGLINTLALDPNLVVNVEGASAGIEMLAKNGLNWSQIAGGAAKSSILLSNATGTDLATSADIATNALGIFGLQVSDLDSVVATFTNAANKSQFGVEDWGYVLANAGPKAKAFGVSLDELFAAVTMTSSGFASGQTAGTSFAYLFNGLTPSTEKATVAMQELGLITQDGANAFFNADGTGKEFTDVIKILQGAFNGLTDEQKMAYSETIFGQEAFGALSGLLGVNNDELAKMIPQMTDFSAVQEGAATRTDTLAARWENFQGKMEALTIQIGEKFLPIADKVLGWISTLVDTYGDDVMEWFDGIAASVGGLVDALANWQDGTGKETVTWLQETMPSATTAASEAMTDFNTQFGEISEEWGETLAALNEFWGKHGDTVMAVVDLVSAYTLGEMTKTLQQLGVAVKFGLNLIQGDWGGAWDNIVEMQEISNTAMERKQVAATNAFIAVFGDAGEGAGDGFGTGLDNSTGKAERSVDDFGNSIASQMRTTLDMHSPSKVFAGFGANVVQGFDDGFDERWRRFTQTSNSTVGGWINWFKGIFKIGSPSDLFADFGKNVVQGFSGGIDDNRGMAMNAMGSLAPAYASSYRGASSQPAVSTARLEELMVILINELRNKNMTVNMAGGGGNDIGLFHTTATFIAGSRR